MQFQFPLREELFEIVNSKDHLKQLLKQEALRLRIGKQHFRLLSQKEKYLYARCRECKSYLRYSREDDVFKLVAFNNNHTHKLNQPSKEIQNFILSLPATMATQSLMQITTQHFNISASKFYYHNQKLWSQKIELKEIFNQLDYLKHQTRYLPFPIQDGDLPDIFITASPAMIANFKKYGQNQFMTFDVTYNLVKQIKRQTTENGQIKNKKWGLGLFLGKNCNNRAICFGFCLLNVQTKDSFMGIFKSFFQMMGGQPATIITDEQIAIDSAIRQLKDDGDFQGIHLWDTFHILRNVSKKTDNNQLRKALRDAMFSKYDNQYRLNLQKSRECCSSNSDIAIYERFVSNAHKYCLSQTQISFCGISISTSFSEKVNDFIKTYLPSEKPFKVVLRKVLKSMTDLDEVSLRQNLCKTSYQEIFGQKQLKLLRFTTCQPVFMAILKNYIESLPLRCSEDGDFWIVGDYQLIVKDRKFFCACGYYQKCGIPCSHLIKLIFIEHQDILNYIHDRWKIQEQTEKKHYYIKRGRPRFSRRHRN